MCRKWELICRDTRRHPKSTRCERGDSAKAGLEEIAAKTHEICMRNKDIIRSQMFFPADAKVRRSERGVGQKQPPQDVCAALQRTVGQHCDDEEELKKFMVSL